MVHEDWLQLLDELEERIPDFARTFVDELLGRALYDTDVVAEEDILRTAAETMRLVIARLHGGSSDAFAEFSERLGKRRARQGVPLDRLIEAIRLDLRIIWRMLLELAEPDRTSVLVQHFEFLMTTLDDYVNDVQQAFLAEVAILQRDSRLATEQHISKLFNATRLSQALLGEVSAGLGVDPDSAFEVILVRPGSAPEQRRREVGLRLAERETFGYVYRGWLLFFRVRTGTLSSWPKELADIPACYVHRVEGLGSVPAAARAAIELHSLAPEVQRLTDIEELWALGAAEHLDSLIPGYFRSILDGLDGLTAEERDRVLRTVRVFLGSGSVKETSVRVGCHRNTVVNRLKLFHAETGLDPMIPAQAALAYVLLAGEPDPESEPAG